MIMITAVTVTATWASVGRVSRFQPKMSLSLWHGGRRRDKAASESTAGAGNLKCILNLKLELQTQSVTVTVTVLGKT